MWWMLVEQVKYSETFMKMLEGKTVDGQRTSCDMAVDDVATQYAEQGFAFAVPVLDAAEVLAARAAFNGIERESGIEASVYNHHNRHAELDWAWNLVAHPTLLKYVTAILGPDVLVLDSRFICKYGSADATQFVSWHQDVAYWPLEPADVLTAWLAIDNSTPATGCMEVIPGSHKLGVVPHRRGSGRSGNLLSMDQEIEKVDNAETAIPLPAPAGFASLHDGALIHWSPPNTSSARRCGFVIRYIKPSVRVVADPSRPRTFPAVRLVAGKDEFHHFDGK